MSKYYVTEIEYCAYYHPEEGGYYQHGEFIDGQYCFSTYKKAKRFFFKLVRDFKSETNWINYNPHSLSCGCRGKYIGDGWEVRMTRKPVKEIGFIPYC